MKPTTKPTKSQRLADEIDPLTRHHAPDNLTFKVVADELRRLHEVNAELVRVLEPVLYTLEGSTDAQQWVIDEHIMKYGERYEIQRINRMKQQLIDTHRAIETLRAALAKAKEQT